MGSRQAGTGLRVLVFLGWIGRTLCYGPSAQEVRQFMEKTRIFPSRSVLVLNCGVHCSFIFLAILSWVRACPYQPLSSLFLILAFLCIGLERLCIGPSLYPDMVQECFPSGVSMSNKKEEGIAIWRPWLSRIKWTPKYAFYEGIKISPLNICFYVITWGSHI